MCVVRLAQIRREQEELASRLGPKKLAFLKKRAQARQASPSSASPAPVDTLAPRSASAGASMQATSQRAGSQAGPGESGAAPRPHRQPSDAGGLAAPPDVHRLLAANAAVGELGMVLVHVTSAWLLS